MRKPVRVHPDALAEADEAYNWLAARSADSAARFSQEVVAAYARIADGPHAFARHPYGPGRYCPLRRFPYVVIFEVHAEHIGVYAVAHTRRAPGYWSGRSDP